MKKEVKEEEEKTKKKRKKHPKKHLSLVHFCEIVAQFSWWLKSGIQNKIFPKHGKNILCYS